VRTAELRAFAGTQIAVQRGVKRLALLTGCLFLLACSSDGDRGGGGQGGQAGSPAGSGGGGSGGQTGGSGGSAGSTGSGGQTGGSTGTGGNNAGRGGNTGTGGQTGGSTGSGGNAGRGGAGGQGGKAGQGGAGGQSCSELQSAYSKALTEAKMCNAALSRQQCTHLVSSLLTCCPTYVDDTTEIDKIYAQWQAAGCIPTIACPAIVCAVPSRANCVPMNSGDWCTDVLTP
jgi:hypothetical protein